MTTDTDQTVSSSPPQAQAIPKQRKPKRPPVFDPTFANPRGELPSSFGFGDPGQSGPPVAYQPINPSLLPPGVVDVDLDGDGIKDDFILPGHDKIEGTTVTIGYITVDNQSIIIVAGEDVNGNGILEREEIIDIVGKCIYPRAEHDCQIVPVAGINYVRWIVREIGPNGLPTGNQIVYFYDPVTGNLIVVQTVLPGSATIIYPALPAVAPPGGVANGYPGWGSGSQLLPPA